MAVGDCKGCELNIAIAGTPACVVALGIAPEAVVGSAVITVGAIALQASPDDVALSRLCAYCLNLADDVGRFEHKGLCEIPVCTQIKGALQIFGRIGSTVDGELQGDVLGIGSRVDVEVALDFDL